MIKAGGEVDAFCSRCELVLAHTIHAVVGGKPVKVECNTCHVVHRYRPAASGTKPAARTHADRPARPRVESFDALLAGRKHSTARPYSPSEAYALDEVVDHPTFGRGFVSAVKDGGKVEITFRTEVRVLVHGRPRP
jgi:hypothetical protein